MRRIVQIIKYCTRLLLVIEANYPRFQTLLAIASTEAIAYLEAQYQSCFLNLSVFVGL